MAHKMQFVNKYLPLHSLKYIVYVYVFLHQYLSHLQKKKNSLVQSPRSKKSSCVSVSQKIVLLLLKRKQDLQ